MTKVKSDDNTYRFLFFLQRPISSFSFFAFWWYSTLATPRNIPESSLSFSFLQLATYTTRISIFNTNLNALYCHLGLNIFPLSSGLSKNSRQLVTMFHTINLLGRSMAKGFDLHWNHSESLLKTQISGLHPQDFWYICLVWNPKICISKFPLGSDATGPETVLSKSLLSTNPKVTISKDRAGVPKFCCISESPRQLWQSQCTLYQVNQNVCAGIHSFQAQASVFSKISRWSQNTATFKNHWTLGWDPKRKGIRPEARGRKRRKNTPY